MSSSRRSSVRLVAPSLSLSLSVAVAVALCLLLAPRSSNALSYSFGEGTPGTSLPVSPSLWADAPLQAIVALGAVPGPLADRIVPDAGVSTPRADVGAGVQLHCGLMVTHLSHGLNQIAILPTGAGGGRTSAVRKANGVSNDAKTFMNKPVIGIVDYGVGGGLHAFVSRSGAVAAVAPIAEVDTRIRTNALNFAVAAGLIPAAVPELRDVAHWHVIDAVPEQGPIQAHTNAAFDITAMPPVADWAAAEIVGQLWANIAQPALGIPNGAAPAGAGAATIGFHVSPTSVHKRWYTGGAWQWESSPNVNGQCAMSKMIFSLSGLPGATPLPPGLAPLKSDPMHADGTAALGPRLVCAAEATHGATFSTKDWAGVPRVYAKGEEVASCVVCQSRIPEVVSGHFLACAVPVPANGARGTCAAQLRRAAACQIECNPGYNRFGASTQCNNGVLAPQTCVLTPARAALNLAIANGLPTGLRVAPPRADVAAGSGAGRAQSTPMRGGGSGAGSGRHVAVSRGVATRAASPARSPSPTRASAASSAAPRAVPSSSARSASAVSRADSPMRGGGAGADSGRHTAVLNGRTARAKSPARSLSPTRAARATTTTSAPRAVPPVRSASSLGGRSRSRLFGQMVEALQPHTGD